MFKAKITFDINRIKTLVAEEASEEVLAIQQKVLTEMKEATPVDTGEAKAGWVDEKRNKTGFALVNRVEHIKYLNAGHSSQAPSRFIEKIALKYGRPLGPVVEYED